MADTDGSVRQLTAAVQAKLDEELSRPLTVSVMGQTGVGKSSLINSLFGTDLRTDAVRPCTKEIERVVHRAGDGHELWFFDLPGIGEAGDVDERYIEQYRNQLLESDLVLWAMHGDSRSVAFDQAAIARLLAPIRPEDRGRLLNKLTVVLTKVDLLTPPPWILLKDQAHSAFLPSKDTNALLAGKAAYCQQAFLNDYRSDLISSTFNDCKFAVDDVRFSYDEYSVVYMGYLTDEVAQGLRSKYPRFADVIDRLRDNHRVVPVSSLFRFNLTQLMLVVLNKLQGSAVGRAATFRSEGLDGLPLAKSLTYCNMVIFDRVKDRVVFDPSLLKL